VVEPPKSATDRHHTFFLRFKDGSEREMDFTNGFGIRDGHTITTVYARIKGPSCNYLPFYYFNQATNKSHYDRGWAKVIVERKSWEDFRAMLKWLTAAIVCYISGNERHLLPQFRGQLIMLAFILSIIGIASYRRKTRKKEKDMRALLSMAKELCVSK
jgi:hypothetical protein